MLKYTEAVIGFSEVPEEITLCINISGCPVHCKGCHSPYLWQDVGEELKPVTLFNLIAGNAGITCVSFMGGDASPEDVYILAKWIRENTNLKVCWYSGKPLRSDVNLDYLDYIKTGPYISELGGLDCITTNQRFYKVNEKKVMNLDGEVVNRYKYLEDITFKFWKDYNNEKSLGTDTNDYA